MSQVIAGNTITRVGIVEDDPSNRKSLAEIVSDARFEPVPENGPLPRLGDFVVSSLRNADAFILDHQLKQSQYAPFNGAEAVATFYDHKRPALLCTTYGKAEIDAMRFYLSKIPVLVRTDDINPDTVATGFECCIREFKNEYKPSRRPWRTLVRIEDLDEQMIPPMFFVVLPGWSSSDKIRLRMDIMPPHLRKKLKPGVRFHAQVNKGEENQDYLYFVDFEFD